MEIAARWRWFVAVCLLSVGSLGTADEKNTNIDPNLIEKLSKSKLELSPGTGTFEAWQVKDITFEIFLFNWTNADDFPGEKPRLVEIGPYRFRMRRKYVDFKYWENDDMLGYNVSKNWELEETGRSLDDVITTVDFITYLVVHDAQRLPHSKKRIKNFMFEKTDRKIFITKTARELLFDGYTDFYLDMYKFVAPPKRHIPKKFGWFYEKNNAVDDFERHLGVTRGLGLFSDMTAPGQIIYWAMRGIFNSSNSYYQEACSMMKGSLGDFFSPNLTEKSDVNIFVPTLCRTIPMRYLSKGEYRGLKYLKFEVALSQLDEAPYDKCFCDGACEFKGAMNTSACRDLPIFMSLPHFLHGDKRLLDRVEGLVPDAEKHSYYYSLEPKTGLPLDVAVRRQLNLYMQGDDAFPFYKGLQKMLFPVYWVQELTSADQRSLESLVPKTQSRKNV